MEIKKQEQVTEFKNVTVGYKCDNCGKEVSERRLSDEWHQFTSGHDEWDNDSFESIERHDVCSPVCYVEKLTKVVSEMEDVKNGEVDGMKIKFVKRMVNYFKVAIHNV